MFVFVMSRQVDGIPALEARKDRDMKDLGDWFEEEDYEGRKSDRRLQKKSVTLI